MLRHTFILPVLNLTSSHRRFQQILHRAANHARQLIDRLRLSFIDVVDPLLIHLDGAQADAGNLCKLCLRQPTAFPQFFQSAFRQHCRTNFIHRLNEFGDVHFVVHYHVRSEGQIVKKAVYIAIGIDLSGKKDVLGMLVGENESAKYWATVLNSLHNRGVEDIFIACTDNLTGFSNAIEAVFPKTDIQNCIIHQLRNSGKYVSYKDLKALMTDLKQVYAAVDEPAAEEALDRFAECWDRKYPKISASWRANWPNLSTYFKFPEELRRLIYTTNAIEGFNRQLRKVTKSKAVFPTDDSLFKMLYLSMLDITKKWTGRRQDWSVIHAQLAVYYADRMPD